MPTRTVYLDTSALVKLVVEEPETGALIAALADWPQRASSVIAEVELLRAVSRSEGGATLLSRARKVLAMIDLIELDASQRQAAAALPPATLRSLDAIHLAAAASLGGDLHAFVAYDRRLFDAARGAGLPALAPGWPT